MTMRRPARGEVLAALDLTREFNVKLENRSSELRMAKDSKVSIELIS